MRAHATTAAACALVAAVVRLAGLGAAGLATAEQVTFVESRGFSTRASLPPGRPLARDALPRRAGLLAVARGASVSPLHTAGLATWAAAAGTSETALRLPSAIAGALAAALAAVVATPLAGPWAGAWAGGFVALSPIHTLASRAAGPDAPLVLGLLVTLALLARVESSGGHAQAAALGLALGLLAVCGVTAFAALSLLPPAWLAARADRRAPAALATAVAIVVAAVATSLGLARSPLDYGEIPSWVPETTASGIVRCTGASFTRVAGLEYQLVVPAARYVIPLTALFVALMAVGALRLSPRARGLIVVGALLPFALGAVLALDTGRVTPLQATRLLAALPFVAVLVAAGLASLRGWRAWVSGAVVGGTLVAFLALALARPGHGTSTTRASALQVSRCRAGETVVVVQRSLDLLALAAWDVPGPFVLRSPGVAPPRGPAIVSSPSTVCVRGGAACGAFPTCPTD